VIDWFEEQILEKDRLPLLLCFVAFVATFVTTRVITRLIRTGRGPFKNNVSQGGVHVHHAVPGVILLVVGAFIAVGSGATAPWAEIGAVLVGIGTSLVLDEFALILHLDDVYWSQEGRVSVEVVSLAFAGLGLVMLGANPFDIQFDETVPWWAKALITSGIIILHFGAVLICVLKRKYKMALIGALIPLVAEICAIRLARPTSRWAKRRYGEKKMAKAIRREEKWKARWSPITGRISDFVAGEVSAREPEPSRTEVAVAAGSAAQVVDERGEHAVDEATAVVRGEALGQLDRLVDDDGHGHVRTLSELEGAEAQHVEVEDRHPSQRPALGL
jgi:hypothetical protein